MLVPMLASCGEDEDDTEMVETATRKAVTLNMFVITEDETTPDAAQAVEDAIKTIIKSKYTTNLEIEFITEADYYKTVEGHLAGMSKAADTTVTEPVAETETAVDTAEDTAEMSGDETGAGAVTEPAETEAVTTEATIVNEYGVTELKYPELEENQIDIFMVTDYDKYLEYVEKGWLYNLSDSIKNASKKLTDYIYPTILDAAKVNGNYYAVPNNRPIGECTYVIVDKAMAKEFGLDMRHVDELSDLSAFFAWVKENKTGVTPLAGSYDDIEVAYMNVNKDAREFTEEFSLVGTYGSGVVTNAESLFANESYKKDLLALAEMKYAGYFGAANAQNFAAAIKTGDAFDMAEYSGEYEIFAIDGETPTNEEICSSMFAVSRFTSEFARAMEVITYLNTNEEFRNLLQYGIKNVNYEVDDITDDISRLNRDYMMDIYKTGNVYMAYPEEDMPLDIWELSKKQNIVMSTYSVDAFGGFEIPEDTETLKVDFETSVALRNASAALLKRLNAAPTFEAYAEIVNGAAEEYASVVEAFLDTTNANTPYALYNK